MAPFTLLNISKDMMLATLQNDVLLVSWAQLWQLACVLAKSSQHQDYLSVHSLTLWSLLGLIDVSRVRTEKFLVYVWTPLMLSWSTT